MCCRGAARCAYARELGPTSASCLSEPTARLWCSRTLCTRCVLSVYSIALLVLTPESLQVVNTGAELLQLTVVISRPPIRVFVYDSWAMPDAQATPSIPYLFDRECLPTDRRLSDPAGPSRSGGGEL